MGLLDTISSKFSSMYDTENPNYEKAQALLGLSQGLLSASGPSRMPVSMGQALGSGLQGMGQGFQQARSTLLAKAKEKRLQDYQTMLENFYKQYGIGGTPPTAPEGAGPAPGIPMGTSISVGPRGPQITVDPAAAQAAEIKRAEAVRGGVIPKEPGGVIPEVTPAERQKQAAAAEQARTEARIKLPDVTLQSEKTKTQIDSLLSHPGLEDSFGVKSYIPAIRGTDRADFEAKLNQFKSTIFIENREKLKGGGAITDYEGNKAAEAEVAMDQAQSQEQFKRSLEEYKYWVDRGLNKLREKAGHAAEPPKAESKTREDDKYMYRTLPDGTVQRKLK